MSTKNKSPNTNNAKDSSIDADKNTAAEKKIDQMLNIEEPDLPDIPAELETPEPIETPAESIVTPSAPTKISVFDGNAEEKSGAPALPVNKTTAFKKKIAVTDASPKAELPADNEIEPFEAPSPVVTHEPIEEVTLSETEVEATPPPDPIVVARERISQLPPPSDELGLESMSTSKAVDEIVAAEADELLVARDQAYIDKQAEVAASRIKKDKKPTGSRKFKKLFIKLFVLALLIGIAFAGAIPASRYAILNAAGVRVSSSVTVFDESTGQALKNAEFVVSGNSSKTDANGNATVTNLKLGKNDVTIKKPAYAEQKQSAILGWGSNPLGEVRIKAVGSQYTIVVTDFLSKKPIAKVEANSGEINARSNDEGKIVLAIPQSDSNDIYIDVTIAGYRKETVKINLSASLKETKLSLVPDRKQAFISKRAGTFDLYKIDVDGTNEQKILSGTGKERSETISLAVHPTKNIAALVSNREPGVNGGESPSTLTIVNLNDNSMSTVTQSGRIQLVDWVGDKLIYVKIGDGEAEASTKRHRLISYDSNTKTERELASTNYFNDVITANGAIYFAPAAYQVNGTVGLYKINADGNYRKSIFDKEVWNLFRTSYDKLSVSIGQEWFDLTLENDTMVKSSAPTSLKSRTYFDSPDSKTSLWTEERDGKGVLINYDKTTKADNILQSQSGIKNPIRWLDAKHIVYRVSNTSEIADYVFNIDGGEPKKIRDVTDTAGIDRWYYY